MSEITCSTAEAPSQLDTKFWDQLWKTKDTGWDLKQVSPPLKHYFDEMTCKNKSILIPGCGNAYEAEYLLKNGFSNVTVIDISPTLCNQIIKKYKKFAGKQLTIICGDFFKHSGQYDFIIEQTFFCALEKNRRKEYAEKMHALLKPTGILAGLLFNKEFEKNPPFGGNIAAYKKLFKPYFEILQMKTTQLSVAPRLGAELFFEMKRAAQL
jgi:SAM-dependent methyltransferase